MKHRLPLTFVVLIPRIVAFSQQLGNCFFCDKDTKFINYLFVKSLCYFLTISDSPYLVIINKKQSHISFQSAGTALVYAEFS